MVGLHIEDRAAAPLHIYFSFSNLTIFYLYTPILLFIINYYFKTLAMPLHLLYTPSPSPSHWYFSLSALHQLPAAVLPAEVGTEAPGMGSPRAANCFHLTQGSSSIIHEVSEADNRLGVGTPFPGLSLKALNNPDLYAAEKELYLGSLCQASDTPMPWQFWMVMLKNGNYDTRSGLCPENGKKAPPFRPGRFPCFGKGCMNQPSLYHQPTRLYNDGTLMRGGFNGSYDTSTGKHSSYYQVVWEKKVGSGSWVFKHKLMTSKKVSMAYALLES